MRPTRFLHRTWMVLASCLLAVVVLALGQTTKAGLYDVTTTMTWQQSPFPAGMGPGGGAHSSQICVSQEQVDKYHGVPPQTRPGCQMTNVSKRDDGFSAEISCPAPMTSQGTVESTYTPDGHGKTKIHMTGQMQMGSTSKTIEYTIVTDTTYKGADCGSVKPYSPPSK